MSERIRIFVERKGGGLNDLIKEMNGSFTFNIGKYGFNPNKSQDQRWLAKEIMEHLDEEVQEKVTESDLIYKIRRNFSDNDEFVGLIEFSM